MSREGLMGVALGEVPADLLIKGGKLVNVHTGDIYMADVAVKGDRIALVGDADHAIGRQTTILDASGKYITPGLIDSHIHIGDLYLTMTELARVLMSRGTTAIASDLYEIYVVSGIEGVKFALEEVKRTPLKVLYVVPAHLIGWENFGTFGVEINPNEMKDMVRWPDAVGLNEPPAASVLGRNQAILDLARLTLEERKIFVGHACETLGKELNAYMCVGAYSDHESITPEEAAAKAQLGVKIIVREGSASPDLANVIKAITEHKMSPRYFMFCSDDEDPIDLVRYGHMDYKVRKAIMEGVDAITAIQMATINAAEYYRVDQDIGSIVPGKIADILLVDNLPGFKVSVVIANGKVVAREGKFLEEIKAPTYPDFLRKGLILKKKIEPEDFEIRTKLDKREVTVRVIGVKDGTLLKTAETATLKVKDGGVLSSIEKDVIKISAIERYKATGRVGNAFVSGFKLKQGAVATTFNHIYHDLVVVGTSDAEISMAAQRLVDLGGGIVVVRKGEVLSRLELPIGGIITEKPLEEVERKLKKVHEAVRELGCDLSAPVITLAFVTLPTIPAYGITDMGLVDVEKLQIVDPVIN